MGFSDPRLRAAHPWRLLLVILCVLLVVVSGTVQAVHIHADEAGTHANCSLCATAHVAIQLVQAPAAVQASTIVAMLPTLRPATVSIGFFTFALFNRPPPVDVVPA